jgi:hypothetical protein
MNGNQEYNEILSTLNRLEIQQTKQGQRFEDYMDARKDIPKELQIVKDQTARCHLECDHHTTETKSYFKKVDFLMTWYGRAAALLFAFQILIAIMVLLGRIVDVEYTMKP